MRDFINRHGVPVAIVSVLVVMAALAVIYRQIRPTESAAAPPPRLFYYDLNTGELFDVPGDTTGPVERPSGPFEGGPAGVLAHVFACGDCTANPMFIGWLEKPDPDAAQPDAPTEGKDAGEPPVLIRRPEKGPWVRSDTPEAARITRAVFTTRCPKRQRATYCRPRHADLAKKRARDG